MIVPDPDLRGDLTLSAGDYELRPLAPGDAADMFDHLSDAEVTAFMDISALTSVEEAQTIVDWATGLRAFGGGVRWAIRARASGAFVGTAGFNAIVVERGRRGEIAYDVSQAWWGKGVMAQVLPALIAFGFDHLALHRLEAMVTPGNDPSCRLLERHGFTREGVLRGYGFWKDGYQDQVVFSKLSPERRRLGGPREDAAETAALRRSSPK